jgi:hypothetical protein
MSERQLYLRLLLNLIIPVLGFWVWNWSLYFILLFYMIDLLSNEVVLHLKIRKIKSIQQQKQLQIPTKIYGAISGLFFLLIISQINLGIVLLYPDFDFKQEIWELGISQGFVLLPLIGMMTYSTYKMDFLVPKMYLRQEEKNTWKNHLKEHFLLLAFCVVLTLFSVAYQFSESISMIVILVITTGYNYLQGVDRIKTNHSQ